MQNRTKRDQELDLLKAFSIFWVIIIHCIYWPNIIDQGIGVSILLFEMPLIFFLIGATNIYAKKRTLRSFYFKRLTRILYPFELYALFVILFVFLTKSFKGSITSEQFILSWINPLGKFYTFEKFLNWHLWFIGTYIILILFLPIIMKAHNHKLSKHIMILFAIILIILDIAGTPNKYIELIEHIRYVVFYGFWIMTGFYYIDIKKIRKAKDFTIPIYTATLGILLGIFYVFINDFIIGKELDFNMQNAKFPPNFLFLSYSIIAMSVIFVFSYRILKIMKCLSKVTFFNAIINAYNHNGFTIYLFHPFVFLAVSRLKDIYLDDLNDGLIFAIYVISTTVISPLLSILISVIERKLFVIIIKTIALTKGINSSSKKWISRLMDVD